ncbi:cell wall-binding repeat-containing protein [Clostridium kluyveri]|uniref:cell wall-binding repeat-containing protein n=1 Tax=Clostridium kluyveri TaxID=1534 RepID=UPI002246F4A4|nr:cell wall-binding repeat-containing protein [Clostridium kluyveri]UZQ50719.1 cell wall-binding repeat-containing protein [Clostridium kluyveri]
MNKRRVLSIVLTFALAITTLSTNISLSTVRAASGEVTRTSGSDRYQTASQVAVTNWTTSDNVVLVSGEGYADAISASVLAKKLNAPILLTTPKVLNSYTKTALDTLAPKNIYVIGGNASVSKEIRDFLKSSYNIIELGGANRYETNVAVAKKLVELGVDPSNAVLVGGEGFSDALTVASIAAVKEQILLLGNNDLNYIKSVKDFIYEYKSSVTVVGTDFVINEDTYKAVNAVKRISGGTDRFDTNLKVLDAFKDDIKTSKFYVANASGDGYADALVASVLAGKNESPLVLLDNETSKSTANAIDYIKTNLADSSEVEVLGGTGVIPENIVTKINGYISPTGNETNPSTGGSSSGTSTTVQTFKGYIQDEDCFISYAPNYGDDTKTCLSMKSCTVSGYGITALQSDGSYKFYYFDGDFATFADGKTFDGTGSQLSAWNLIQNTSKKDHITITVKGTLKGDTKISPYDGKSYPVITVSSLTESSSSSGGSGSSSSSTSTEQTFAGYIIDKDCFSPNSNPGDDTKPCLSMKSCAASGYGIGVPQDDGTYKFYYFDGQFAPNATGTQAKAYDLIDKSTKNTRISIAVTGKLNGDVKVVDGVSYPVITVSSLAEGPEPITVPVTTSKVYEGWLSDETNAKDVNDPTEIAKSCLGNSDYGIVVVQSDYSFKFYKFDTKGQELAKNILDKTEKERDLRIKINGVLDESTNTIKLSTIEEEQELVGIILTKSTFDNSSDPTAVKRDDIVVSADSGYGVAVKGDDGKYKFYVLDEAGNKSAKSVLSWYVNWADNVSSIPVLVRGIVEVDNIITSAVIRERCISGQLVSKAIFDQDKALKDITKVDLLTPESAASGYGYYVHSCGGHQYFPFDKDSNDLVRKFIESSTTTGKIKVKPYGFWYWIGNTIKLNNIVEDIEAEAEEPVDEEISGVVATRSYFKGSEYQELGVPGTITKDFLLDSNNAASGYGIIYRTCCRYGYLRFDENGTKLIKDIINKSNNTSNINVIVQGKRDEDTIYVTSVVEAYDQTYSGTLLKTDTEGYGVKVKQEDGTYKFYKLSTKGDYYHESGQEQAKDFLSDLKKDTTTVDIKGTFDGDSIVVSSIKENLSITPAPSESEPKEQAFTGYIQDQDCFISYAPNYGDDTKMCLSMKSCAASGYGITALESDGSYKFYYFDGDFATFADGKNFDGTGSQLSAWNLIQNTTKKNNITITVKGTLNGETKTAPDGNTYQVVTVTSLAEN